MRVISDKYLSILVILILGINSIKAQISRNERQLIFLSSQSVFELSGFVTQGNFVVDSAIVYIYREQVQGTVELVDSIHSFGQNGKYSFTKMVSGTYYLRAKQYRTNKNFIDTYYGGSPVWINSTAIILRQNMLNKTIDLAKESDFKGSASITGNVEYGSGDVSFPMGEKAKNIPVLVMQNGTVIRRMLTDINGDFKFTNLPIMSYNIVIDYPGKSMAAHLVKLSSSKISIENQNFILEKTKVNFKGWATGIESENSKQLKIYPIPCKTELFLKNLDTFSHYKIIDCTGKTRISGDTEDLQPIDVDTLESGIYFLVLEGNIEKKVVKITKE